MRWHLAVVVTIALGVLAGACGSESSNVDTSRPVSAYPSPGTPTASPRTQISLRGVAPDRLGEVKVAGSRSGEHEGHIEAHSDGKGGSYLLDEPLISGEQVDVDTELSIRGGEGDGDFAFNVARTADHGVPFPPRDAEPEPGDVLSFRSEPDLHPPNLRVETASTDPSDSLMFTGPKTGPGQDGPMITDERGNLIWFHPMDGERVSATSVRRQEYRGAPVITWWEGKVVMPGYGLGEYVITDDSYDEVRRVRAGNGYRGDLHDFVVTSRDTALILSYQPVQWDLSGVGGERDGLVLDGVVQEIDIETGLVMFEWHSLGNVEVDESHSKLEDARGAYDYLHVNSVAELGGDLLISARNTWALYRIDRDTGEITWRLGGRRSDFEMGPGTRPAWQHDARPHDDGTISLFDNGSTPKVHPQSRGIVLDVDTEAMKVTLKQAFTHKPELVADAQGTMQPLPDGGALTSWGPKSIVAGFGPDGAQRFNARFPRGVDTYTAYQAPWTGRPQTPPALAVEREGDGAVSVYASWNGATEVASWEVLAGPGEDDLSPVTSAEWDGFETRIEAPIREPYVAVRALDADGQELAVSETVAVGGD